MINHAYAKDATQFEKAFGEVMADKVETALGAKFDSMYGAPEGEQLEMNLEPQDADEPVEEPDLESEQ